MKVHILPRVVRPAHQGHTPPPPPPECVMQRQRKGELSFRVAGGRDLAMATVWL